MDDDRAVARHPVADAAGEPSRRRRRVRPEPEGLSMDMTPMIDVVFQLLIFFMCATRFKSLDGKLLAYLPKTKGDKNVSIPAEPLPIPVSLTWSADTRQCKVYVGQKYVGLSDQGGFAQAARRVRELKAAGTVKAEIYAPPALPFRHVVAALDMLVAAQLKEISFAGRG